jgi:hypothetical protein
MWNSLDVPDEMAETADPLRTKADVGVKVPIIQEAGNWWAAIATDVWLVSGVITIGNGEETHRFPAGLLNELADFDPCRL